MPWMPAVADGHEEILDEKRPNAPTEAPPRAEEVRHPPTEGARENVEEAKDGADHACL